MHFFAALKSGASVKNVAFEFTKLLLEKSWVDDDLNLDVACDFVNDIFKAIGLECAITPQQINEGWSYIWPMEQIQIYNFHYIEMEFKKVEEFLLEICILIKHRNDAYTEDSPDVTDSSYTGSPVEFLMQLVAVWCSAFKHLLKFEELQLSKRFEEPLSRINFHLLLGMHELRKLYRLDLHILDAICNRLYWSALDGLYYRQTHDMVFSGLLKVFSKNYDLFYASSTRTINFFYEAFAVEINTLTPLKLYKTFQDMLLAEVPSQQLEILLNFLIEPQMLRVYFTTFRVKKYKWHKKITNRNIERIRQEALKFLHVLQNTLISLDCFSREFMEALLNLIFKSDNTTSSLATNLYVDMMTRKYSEQLILKHIMDFYVTRVCSTANLRLYVQALYGNFGFLLNFNYLLELITDEHTEQVIRLLSAHIIVLVVELKTENRATDQELQHLLQILPELFENLHCQKTEGILLKVFNFFAVENLQKPVIDNFVHYAMGIFTYTDSHLEYPLLMNIFSIFHKFLMYNREWQHLERLSKHLLLKYQEMIRTLQQQQKRSDKSISRTQLENYNHLVKRLNILMKLKYDLWDNSYLNIIRNLSGLFLYNTEIKMLINENNSLMDIYVLEIIVSCLLKLQQAIDKQRINNFMPEVNDLFVYLGSIIKNVEELQKLPIVKIKTYFCCFLQLIMRMPLELDNNTYHQLLQVLIAVLFEKKFAHTKGANELQQLHPLQALEYQHLMLRLFTEMHKCQRLNSTFHEDLKNLLVTLANYRLHIYKHIISVIVYNLYKQTPALMHVTIVSILKKHKHLIDNNIKVDSSQLLKIHVVLLVLQILAKALSVQRMKAGQNRLEALRHLNIFIEDLDLNQLQAKELLLEQMNQMGQHLMNAEESKLIANFKELLDKQEL